MAASHFNQIVEFYILAKRSQEGKILFRTPLFGSVHSVRVRYPYAKPGIWQKHPSLTSHQVI